MLVTEVVGAAFSDTLSAREAGGCSWSASHSPICAPTVAAATPSATAGIFFAAALVSIPAFAARSRAAE